MAREPKAPEAPAAPPPGSLADLVNGTPPIAQTPVTTGRKTTRGLLPEIKAIAEIHEILSELPEADRRFVLIYINGKFPHEPK